MIIFNFPSLADLCAISPKIMDQQSQTQRGWKIPDPTVSHKALWQNCPNGNDHES